MPLSEFAADAEPLDMTQFDEFVSLRQSASDLGIAHSPHIRYVSRNAVINQLRLHFLEWGDAAAPPILLLHGSNQSAHSWDLVSLYLADRHHVYALDQRGHGDSEWARDADYGTGAMVEDALGLVRAEGLQEPIVIGHSMGGIVALSLALKEPALLRALVVVDSGPQISAQGAAAIAKFITHNVEFDSVDEFIDRVARYDPFRSREHMQRTARYNLIQRADGKYISKSDRLLHDPDFRAARARTNPPVPLEKVAEIRCPTLVVRGESSNILEPKAAEAFVRRLPAGALVTVPKCGHNVHTQNTPGFLDAIRPFLASL